jgi:hypothetical protein
VAASRLLALLRRPPVLSRKMRDSISPRIRNLMPLNPLLRRIVKKIKSLFRPEDPHEYALVRVPVRPKLPTLSARAEALPERDY